MFLSRGPARGKSCPWSGRVLWESQNPGSFRTGRDRGYFLRFEVIFQQKWRLPAQWLAVR